MHINYEYGMDRNILTNFPCGWPGRGIGYHPLLRLQNHLYTSGWSRVHMQPEDSGWIAMSGGLLLSCSPLPAVREQSQQPSPHRYPAETAAWGGEPHIPPH